MTPILTAIGPAETRLFAAVVPSVRFVAGEVRQSRMGALLAPFKSTEEARAALLAAGGQIEEAA